MRRPTLLASLAVAAIVAGCSHVSGHPHAQPQPSAPSATPEPTTVDIQGAGDWKKSPHMRAYYDETVITFANGTDIDIDAYEVRSFAIFREFARAHAMNEEGMIDHLKLIPRQVVDIVKENPGVLQDYDSFWAALAGPD